MAVRSISRIPAFLAESTALALGARVVFGTPSAPGAASFLEREGVTHLLVATDPVDGTDLGGYLPFATDVAAIRADPRFRLVREFDDGRLLLFEVRPWLARQARTGRTVSRRSTARSGPRHGRTAGSWRSPSKPSWSSPGSSSGRCPQPTGGPTWCGWLRPGSWRSSRPGRASSCFIATSVFFEPADLTRVLAPRQLIVVPLAIGILVQVAADRFRWRPGPAIWLALLLLLGTALGVVHTFRVFDEDVPVARRPVLARQHAGAGDPAHRGRLDGAERGTARARRGGRGRRSWRRSCASSNTPRPGRSRTGRSRGSGSGRSSGRGSRGTIPSPNALSTQLIVPTMVLLAAVLLARDVRLRVIALVALAACARWRSTSPSAGRRSSRCMSSW